MADQNDVIEPPRMSKAEAQDIFNRVITNTVTYKRENGVLLFRLDKERGWEALGYKSWRECALEMGTQMGIQQSTVYNLRDWAEVNDNLSRGTGKVVRLPEMHALALKDLRARTAGARVPPRRPTGREDQRPPAIGVREAARKVAPSAPKKKRKASATTATGGARRIWRKTRI
jgi:hypothetical protein